MVFSLRSPVAVAGASAAAGATVGGLLAWRYATRKGSFGQSVCQNQSVVALASPARGPSTSEAEPESEESAEPLAAPSVVEHRLHAASLTEEWPPVVPSHQTAFADVEPESEPECLKDFDMDGAQKQCSALGELLQELLEAWRENGANAKGPNEALTQLPALHQEYAAWIAECRVGGCKPCGLAPLEKASAAIEALLDAEEAGYYSLAQDVRICREVPELSQVAAALVDVLNSSR